jgi:hypothetical protein
MKQIVPGQKARSPTYLMLLILVIGAAIALSVSGVAVAKKCDNPPCGGGGGGDDHGDPPAQYFVELTQGGFYFPGQVVTRNNRGNSYSSTEGLNMNRGGGPFPDSPTHFADPVAWDEVFDTCPTAYPKAYPDNPIQTVVFGDDWSIDNSGGNSAGDIGSRVNLSFRNGHAVAYPEVEIDLYLWGTLLEPGIPAEAGDEDVYIELDKFSFYVHAHGNDSCKITGEFVDGIYSVLMMRYEPANP